MANSEYCPAQEICGLRKHSSDKREFALVLIEPENKYYCTALEGLGLPQNKCSYVSTINRVLKKVPLSDE